MNIANQNSLTTDISSSFFCILRMRDICCSCSVWCFFDSILALSNSADMKSNFNCKAFNLKRNENYAFLYHKYSNNFYVIFMQKNNKHFWLCFFHWWNNIPVSKCIGSGVKKFILIFPGFPLFISKNRQGKKPNRKISSSSEVEERIRNKSYQLSSGPLNSGKLNIGAVFAYFKCVWIFIPQLLRFLSFNSERNKFPTF